MAFKIKPKAQTGEPVTPPPQKVAEPASRPHDEERKEMEAVRPPAGKPPVDDSSGKIIEELESRIDGLTAERDEKTQELATARSELAAAVQRAEKAERDVSEAKIRSVATIDNLAKKLEAKEKERDEAKTEAKAAKDALATKGENLSTAESQLIAIRSERDWARNAKAAAEDSAAEARRVLAEKEAELGTKTARIAELEGQADEKNEQIDQLLELNAAAGSGTSADVATATARAEAAESDAAAKAARIAELTDAIDAKNEQIDKLLEKVGTLEGEDSQELATAKSELGAARQELETVRQGVEAMRAELRQANADLGERDATITRLETANAQLGNGVDDRDARIRELEAANAQLSADKTDLLSIQNQELVDYRQRANTAEAGLVAKDAQIAVLETKADQAEARATAAEARAEGAENRFEDAIAESVIHSALLVISKETGRAAALMGTLDPGRFHRVLQAIATTDPAGPEQKMFKTRAEAVLAKSDFFDDVLLACGLNNNNTDYVIGAIDADRMKAAVERMQAGTDQGLKDKWNAALSG